MSMYASYSFDLDSWPSLKLRFDGTDVTQWIRRIQTHYDHSSTPPEDRLYLTQFLVDDATAEWYGYWADNNVGKSWDEFLVAINLRFDGYVAVDPLSRFRRVSGYAETKLPIVDGKIGTTAASTAHQDVIEVEAKVITESMDEALTANFSDEVEILNLNKATDDVGDATDKFQSCTPRAAIATPRSNATPPTKVERETNFPILSAVPPLLTGSRPPLEILGVFLDEGDFSKILLGSPQLEDLVICSGESNDSLSICSSSLKELSIDKYDFNYTYQSVDSELRWNDFLGERLREIFSALQHVEKVVLSVWSIQVFGAAAGKYLLSPPAYTFGDIGRAWDDKILPFCDEKLQAETMAAVINHLRLLILFVCILSLFHIYFPHRHLEDKVFPMGWGVDTGLLSTQAHAHEESTAYGNNLLV